MTQFKYDTSIPLTNDRSEILTLYYDRELDGGAKGKLEKRGKQLMLDARAALIKTYRTLKQYPDLIDKVDANVVPDSFLAYFAMPKPEIDNWKNRTAKPREFQLLLHVVTKTLTGLVGSQYLKVGNIAATRGRNTLGRVMASDPEETPKSKPYHNVVKQLGGKGKPPMAKDAPHQLIGAITIGSKYFFSDDDRNGGLLTLIHEATHKYAGTLDEFYIGKDFLDHKSDLTYKGKSFRKAIVNADSYANLAARIFRA
jgi:hypothetical protein